MAVLSANRECTTKHNGKACTLREYATKGARAEEKPFAFLTETVCSKRSYEVDTAIDYGITEDSLAHIERVVKRFCELREVPFEYERKENVTANLVRLYDIVKSGLEGDDILNFHIEDGRVNMSVSRNVEFPEYTMFFMPICCLDTMDEEMKDIMIGLFSLMYQCGFSLPKDNMMFQFVLGLWDDAEVDEDEDDDTKELRESYIHGKIDAYFKRIEQARAEADDVIIKAMKRLETHPNEFRLIEVIIDGANILKESHINEFSPDPDLDSDNEWLDTSQLMGFSWGDTEDDCFMSSFEEMMNTDCSNYDSEGIFDYTLLREDDNHIWEPSDWPKRLCDWFNKLYDILYNE